MNQLFQQLNPPQNLNNPFINNVRNTLASVRQLSNPNVAQQIISQNPNIKQALDYVNASGGDAKTAFYKLMKENNIDPATVLNSLKM